MSLGQLAMAAEGSARILTVSRGMEVLRAFRAERVPLTNAELVRRTGLAKATVSRLTTTLMQLGFLRHLPGSREFELAAGPLAIGNALVASSALLKAAEAPLQELADRLGMGIALGVPEGDDMLYIAYRASTRVVALRLGVGALLPMGTTAIGHAWLWALPPAQREARIAALAAAAGERSGAVRQSIATSFDELESTGTCAVLGQFQRDAYGIALPVRIGRDRVLMGLNAGKADMQPDVAAEHRRVTPALRAAAAQLEQTLANFDSRP
ncbi:IclR family transcriptional regulator [Ramlibacter sp.]|uniref:IclR family transcriptional regulator n=1 Tax=Ramlibacter sp. TaxID=1917967 RepID=UPI003D122B6B